MEELSNDRIVGVIKNIGNGYVLTDNMDVTLPDSFIERVVAQGISDDDYEVNHTLAVQKMNEAINESFSRISKTTPGHIYAVIAGGTIKIGKSKTVSTRLKMYEKAFPNYRLIGMFESKDITKDERETLAHFGGRAGSDEWLIHSPKLENAIFDYFTIRSFDL